ncbi:MAG: permease [Vicinamibacterales bacterium]|nr:permease [Vicinamibacterales bacterium]
MRWTDEWKWLVTGAVGFLAIFFLPIGAARFDNALMEALHLLRWYAREHVVLCLLPAFFIAGAITVFVSQDAVLKYLGAGAKKAVSYGVASVSGTILAVCSCTVLPLFAGIYMRGAGLGPATAFLYSGPAINVLAIVLTARVLGPGIGAARAVGAIAFSVIIGLTMHLLFRREESRRQDAMPPAPGSTSAARPLWQQAVFFALLIAILVFANWAETTEGGAAWAAVAHAKWMLTALFGAALAVVLVRWYRVRLLYVGGTVLATAVAAMVAPAHPVVAFAVALLGLGASTSVTGGEAGEWFSATWEYTKQITPLLLGGVLVAGLLLGRPGHEGLIPSAWVASAVGGNSLLANLFSSMVGAFMYFATLTEVPIVQGLVGSGMGRGPALALLLAGPALSLPSMLVIRSVLGARKTMVYIVLVVVMSTLAGMAFGAWI